MASASPSQTVSPKPSLENPNKRARTSCISQDAITVNSTNSSTTTASNLRALLSESIASLDSAIARSGKDGETHAVKLLSTTSSGQMLSVVLETNRRLEREKMEMRREIEGLRERVTALEELRTSAGCEGRNKLWDIANGSTNREDAEEFAELEELEELEEKEEAIGETTSEALGL